jgi:hypothetical protein
MWERKHTQTLSKVSLTLITASRGLVWRIR